MEVSEHKTKTDKYRLIKDHSCNTFLYTIINTMTLIISIADISKWTVPSAMSYVITLENTHWEGVNVMVMLFNTTFNIILLISWQSILFVEENGVPGESQRSVASNWQTLLHSVVWVRFELTTLLVIGTACTYSYKSNFHKMMTKKIQSRLPMRSPLLSNYLY
jgi:predicted MFS family arabinose efflux permease